MAKKYTNKDSRDNKVHVTSLHFSSNVFLVQFLYLCIIFLCSWQYYRAVSEYWFSELRSVIFYISVAVSDCVFQLADIEMAIAFMSHQVAVSIRDSQLNKVPVNKPVTNLGLAGMNWSYHKNAHCT